MTEQYIVIDLEMNPVSKANREARRYLFRETIEIGAVRIDADTYKVVDSFNCYVKPQYNDIIVPGISELTGITMSAVCTSHWVFKDAISAFENWIGYDVPTKIYSWSMADLKQLQDECKFKKVDLPDNMKQWFDFQALYREVMGLENNNTPALHTAAEQFGLTMNSKAHSALYDAEITAELLVNVLSGEYKLQAHLLQNAVLKKSDECACSIGDSCGAVLQRFLRQLSKAV